MLLRKIIFPYQQYLIVAVWACPLKICFLRQESLLPWEKKRGRKGRDEGKEWGRGEEGERRRGERRATSCNGRL